MPRTATIHRQTAETTIDLESEPRRLRPGTDRHRRRLLRSHADAVGQARGLRPVGPGPGDLHVDQHHTVEDVGICLGQALRQALGDKAGIRRYGHFTLPMEETLVTSAIDLSGRYFLVFQVPFSTAKIGDFDSELVEDFWQAVAANGLFNLHVVWPTTAATTTT